MNILIISTTQQNGGAAIAANRLMAALNTNVTGVHATMLVRDKNDDNSDVSTVPAGKISRKLKFAFERAVIWLCNGFDRKHLFEVSIANAGFDITGTAAFKNADLIHIHWTQQGMLSLSNIEKILRSGKPVVWTMHDMWACTGICHHAEECTGYFSDCRICPKCKGKLASRIFERKLELYKYPFNVITCSHWLEQKALSSALLAEKPIHCIANAVDTGIFCPKEKDVARKALSLPAGKPLVLFASQKVTDKRKGIDYLVSAANILKQHGHDIEFIVMGNNANLIAGMLPYPVHSMGYVSSIEQAAMIYQAADMFVTPSLMDNLPNTIAESLACGTPCVGFSIGGIPEMIGHMQNGYVARYKDAADFAAGIEWVLNHPDREALSRAAVLKARSSYSQEVVAQQHIELYRKLLGQ